MRFLVPTIVFAAILLGSLSARADVVILKGNDVPLTGRIVREEDGYIRFQIKGLGSTSTVDIEKSRIVRYWREENTYWEYLKGEKERQATLDRLQKLEEQKRAEAGRTEKEAAEAKKPVPPAPVARLRTEPEIRRDLLTRAMDRVRGLIPGNLVFRLFGLLVLYFVLTLLLFAGSRVADLPRLKFARAALLALATVFFTALAIASSMNLKEPQALPAILAGVAVAWVLLSRLLAGGAVSKSVLLLSFFLACVLLLSASLFSVLVAL
jgi:hypothetical protein